jgi:hypothetical protein
MGKNMHQSLMQAEKRLPTCQRHSPCLMRGPGCGQTPCQQRSQHILCSFRFWLPQREIPSILGLFAEDTQTWLGLPSRLKHL